MKVKYQQFVLLFFLLIGVFLRFHQLTTLPPEAGFDPAYYGIDALQILNGERPVYFATNFGREPLFSYLVAILFATVGVSAFSIHLTSAFVSILTLVAVYFLGTELFKWEQRPFLRHHGALLMVGLVSVSFWHLMWTRYSVRVILIPLLFSLTIGFLLKWLRQNKHHYIGFVGAGLGIGLYTYQLAQPLIILVVAILVVYFLWHQKFPDRQQRRHLFLSLLIMLIMTAPLFAYSQQNPGSFNRRLDDVAVVERETDWLAQIDLLSERVYDVAQIFFVLGDDDPSINIPGRPVLSSLLAVFFGVGLLTACYRWRNWIYPILLFWLVFYSLPGVLADSAALAKRTFGALPAVFALSAVGLGMFLDYVEVLLLKIRVHLSIATVTSRSGMIMIILFLTSVTYHDFFYIWPQDLSLPTHYMGQQANIGRFIAQLPETEEIYLSPIWRENAPIILYSGQREGIHDFNGRHCFVYPQTTSDHTTYLLAPNLENKSTELIGSIFPTGTWVQQKERLEQTDFSIYQIPAHTEAVEAPLFAVEANWDNQIQLLGYDLEDTAYQKGESVTLTLYYLAAAPIRFEWVTYIHVRTENNDTVVMAGQRDRQPCVDSYPTTRWQKGQVIRDEFVIHLSADVPDGEYAIFTGFYNWPSLERLPLIDNLEATGDEVRLTKIQLK